MAKNSPIGNRIIELVRSQSITWLSVVLVLIPTLFFVQRQWRSLTQWRQASKIANELTIERALTTLDSQLRQQTVKIADAFLSAPSSVLTDETRLKSFVQLRAKRLTPDERQIASMVMTQSFEVGQNDTPLFVSTVDGSVIDNIDPHLADAAFVATLYWKLLAEKLVSLGPSGYSVEESEPDYPLVLAPVSDEERRLVGVIAIVLDVGHIRQHLMPSIVDETLKETSQLQALNIRVLDDEGSLVVGSPVHKDHDHIVKETMAPTFVLQGWQFHIDAQDTAVNRLAGSLRVNLALSCALAIVLLAGLALALRAASHHRHLSNLKTEFVSNVSHELRTPVSSIRAFSEMISSGRVVESSKVKLFGQHIESESKRLAQLIENILDFSKLESGDQTYNKEPVCINSLVAECVFAYQGRLDHPDVKVQFHDSCSNPLSIEAEKDTIQLVFNNLIDNAVKYGPDNNEVNVRLDAREDQVIISVSDNGYGIAANDQSKVFERFHRVGDGLVHHVRGTGLGLAIARQIVLDHDGTIQLQSEIGKGSTFTVSLPIHKQKNHIGAAVLAPTP